MDSDLLKSLFLKAKDQYESANRWSYIAIFICLIFHLMTFTQFISVKKKQSEVIAAKDHYIQMSKLASEIKTDLEVLNNQISKPMKGRIDKLLADLKSDFDALDRSVAGIKTNATAQFTSTSADYLLNSNLNTDMRLQMPISQMQSKGKTFEINNDLRNKIIEASNPEDLRELLLPIIEQKIIKNRFNELNNYWHKEEVVKIKKNTEKIIKKIDDNNLLLSDESIIWRQILDSMEKVEQVSITLNFIPPQDPYWWTTVSGKLARLSGIREAALQEFQNAIQKSNLIDNLTMKMRAALAKQKELQSSLKERIKKIQDDFNNYQAKLSNINKTFGIISLDLNYIVPLFPLLLGIILAIHTFWCSYRLRELIGIALLIEKKDPEMIASELVYLWTGILSGKSQENDHSEQTIGDLSMIGKKHFKKIKNIRIIIYCIWIIITVAQLIRLNSVNRTQVVMFGIIGCFFIVITQVLHWQAKSLLVHD